MQVQMLKLSRPFTLWNNSAGCAQDCKQAIRMFPPVLKAPLPRSQASRLQMGTGKWQAGRLRYGGLGLVDRTCIGRKSLVMKSKAFRFCSVSNAPENSIAFSTLCAPSGSIWPSRV